MEAADVFGTVVGFALLALVLSLWVGFLKWSNKRNAKHVTVNAAMYKEAKRASYVAEKSSDVAEKSSDATSPSVSYPKPLPLLHPNAQNFEEYCTEWCHWLGYLDAVKTQNTRDGGIDIRASNMIAQVKFYAHPVGVAPVRELNGVKDVGQEALFFALNGFTAEARKFASEGGIQLISVRPVEGTIDVLL